MRRIGYSSLALVLLVIGLSLSAMATAPGRICPGNTPNPNGAVLALRAMNSCPTSDLNVVNNYPAQIVISDNISTDCFMPDFNLHSWSFSTDGGQTKAAFENCSHYRFAATVVLDGTGYGEAGLRLSPWWAADVDGRFMLNMNSSEIACFGGRLPFYSFTVNYGLHYVKGTPARLDITYNPHSLTQADPATIIYRLTYGGNTYSSGPLAFDQGNPAEDPPHGLWGELVPAYAGGYLSCLIVGAGMSTATFSDIFYEGPSATPAVPTTWGRLKTLYR